ncbi:MAG TPA: M28 family peptidase [Gemmatimonadales bacterium]|nr:M28 family peptidase [Gemmatimonadales bacterium]
MNLLPYAILLAPTLLAAQTAGPMRRAAETITAADIMRQVSIIAADSMMGRDNPSRGLELTAGYVVNEFRQAGLRPAGDAGGYVQRFGLSRWTIDTARSTVTLVGGRRRSVARVGIQARYVDGSITDAPVRGEILLLSGPDTPKKEQLHDRAVLLVLDYSRPLPPSLGDQIYRIAAAGPKAVLLLSNRDSISFVDRLASSLTPRLTRDSDTNALAPIIELHEGTLGPVLRGAGIDPDQLRRDTMGIHQPIPELTAVVDLRRSVLSRAQLPNVLGILEGTDPKLRDQYVAYSAHIDHIGVSPGQPDSVNNGADDNASGVAGLLELAQAFSQPGVRPRRSLLFFAPSAEEPGLVGSAHFTEHPTVPLRNIVANINMDLIGRNWRDSVIAVGPEFSDLGRILEQVVSAHSDLHMTPIPDRWPEERIFYRSDHYNFARRGVPILFFTSGTHPDYHLPSDEPQRIDGEKESRLVRLLFHLGAEVANQTARPRWNSESYQQIVERN